MCRGYFFFTIILVCFILFVLFYLFIFDTTQELRKPKNEFNYEQWRKNPFVLRFATDTDRMQYFLDFKGKVNNPRALELVLNGHPIVEDVKQKK
jgi:hypothetical protein